MKDFFSQFTGKMKEIWGRLDVRQRVVISVLTILTLAAFIMLITWSSRTEYGLLFGNMEEQEAQDAMDKLTEMGVKYKIGDDGKSLLVPNEQVYPARIKLAADGVLKKKEIGYEIFDSPSLGITERVQDINYQRAMEGELQRTISSINGVEYVRVHLVIPKEKLFEEEQNPPSASVLIHTKDKLNPAQISGITNLIASAVEGLESRNISVIDQKGDELTESYDDTIFGSTDHQLKISRRLEGVYRNKVQYMLDNILEPGNTVVSVTAHMNFDKRNTTIESFNPDSRVIRSEEIETSNTEDVDDTATSSTEHSITNYEIDKTIQSVTNEAGNLTNISVSVSVNYRTKISEVDGKVVKEYVERPAGEIAQIDSLVKNAVGFNAARGDRVFVNSMRFEDTGREHERLQIEKEKQQKNLISMVEKGAVLFLLLVLMFMLYSQFRKVFARTPEEEEASIRPALAQGEAEREGFYPEGEEGMHMGEGKISYTFKPMKDIEIEQSETLLMQESVKKFCLEHSDIAVKLIKSWLMDKPISRGT